MNRKLLPVAVALTLASCSAIMGKPTPDFYPNDTLRRHGVAGANAAAQECMTLADEYVKQPNVYTEALKQGVGGAAIGAGTGAVGGAIFGNAGRGTGAGAAIGGILGVLRGASQASEPSPSYERFVERCLQQKGYEVVGWSAK
jgi:outer membrane lipoprotein SlyB